MLCGSSNLITLFIACIGITQSLFSHALYINLLAIIALSITLLHLLKTKRPKLSSKLFFDATIIVVALIYPQITVSLTAYSLRKFISWKNNNTSSQITECMMKATLCILYINPTLAHTVLIAFIMLTASLNEFRSSEKKKFLESLEQKTKKQSRIRRTISTDSILPSLRFKSKKVRLIIQKGMSPKRSISPYLVSNLSQESSVFNALDIAVIAFNDKYKIKYSNSKGILLLSSFDGILGMLKEFINKKTHHTLEHETKQFFLNNDIPKLLKFIIGPNSKSKEVKVCYMVRMTFLKENKCIVLNFIKRVDQTLGPSVISDSLSEITSCSLFHELVNLINGVYGNIQMLEDCIPNGKNSFYKNALFFSNVLTLRLRDIDDFIKISHKKFKAHVNNIELKGLLIDFKNIIIDFAKYKRIDLTITMKKESPKSILTDRARLLQILVNVAYAVIESIDFGAITIETCYDDEGCVDISFSVKSNEKAKLATLFNSCKNYQCLESNDYCIKNIEGICLISTIFICNEL